MKKRVSGAKGPGGRKTITGDGKNRAERGVPSHTATGSKGPGSKKVVTGKKHAQGRKYTGPKPSYF